MLDPSQTSPEAALASVKPIPVQESPLIKYDRVSGVLRIHYEHIETEPIAIDEPFSSVIPQGPEPYGPRRLSLQDEWIPLDLGWLAGKNPGMAVIVNKSKTNSMLLCFGDGANYLEVLPNTWNVIGLCPATKAQIRGAGATPEKPVSGKLIIFPR